MYYAVTRASFTRHQCIAHHTLEGRVAFPVISRKLYIMNTFPHDKQKLNQTFFICKNRDLGLEFDINVVKEWVSHGA